MSNHESINSSTPLIQPLRNQAGTFYTFSSAVKNLNSLFDNDQYKMEFSKFVLLDLPETVFEADPNFKNKIHPRLLEGRNNADVDVDNYLENNKKNEIAASFQNFILNFETLLLNRQEYIEDVELPNVAERLFFKWLIETGAIRFNMGESTLENADTIPENRRYVEEETATSGTQLYKRVVKHLGDINILNRLTTAGRSFSEIYVNVPSGQGNTPDILFKSVKDNNYQNDITLASQIYIEGQNSFFGTETELPLAAFPNRVGEYKTATDLNYNLWDATADLNDEISAIDSEYNNNILRSKLDGISVDFTESNYTEVADRGFNSLDEFNESDLSDNFKFNAILVYFDVHKNIGDDNWKFVSRNLYGVQFISPPTEEGTGAATTITIPSLQKFKTNALGNSSNGNSYGFRLNVVFDSSVDQLTETTVVNDDNSSFLELFRSVMSDLQQTQESLINITEVLQKYDNKINQLEDVLYTSGKFSSQNLDERIRRLEQINTQSSPIYEITSPANTWMINHKLNMYPSVTVVDSDNNVMYPAIKYINDSKIEITFGRPETGKVYLGVVHTDSPTEPPTFTTE